MRISFFDDPWRQPRWPGPRALLAGLAVALGGISCEQSPTDPLVEGTVRLRIVEPVLTVSNYLGDSMEVNLVRDDTLLAAPPGGVPLAFVSRDPSCISVPAVVPLEAGRSTARVKVNYGGGAAVPCVTFVVLTGDASISGDSVLVAAVNEARIELRDTLVIGQGLQHTLAGTLVGTNAAALATRPAPMIHFTSLDSAIVRVANDHATASAGRVEALTVSVSGVNGSVGITVHATAGASGQTARIVASGVGFRPDTIVVRVAPVAVALEVARLAYVLPLSGPIPTDVIRATIGTDTSRTGTPSIRADVVRVGGTPVPVSFVNTDTARADLLIGASGVPGDSITVLLTELQSRTADSGEGAVQFRPASSGTTRVRARIAGQVAAVESAPITITAPDTTPTRRFFSTGPMHIGAGLQGARSVRVGLLSEGGVDFTVRALEAGKLLFSRLPGEAGSATGGNHIAPGEPDAFAHFQLHSREGFAGDTVPIVMEAPSFVPETILVVVESPRYSFFPPANASYALNAVNVSMRIALRDSVRVGGSPLTVFVVNDSVPLANVSVDGVVGDSVPFTILPGTGSRTGYLLPVSPGVLRLRTVAAGFTALTATERLITLTPAVLPKLELEPNRRIGQGMYGMRAVNLPVPAPATGVRISIWTNRSDRITLGTDSLEQGSDSIEVRIDPTLTYTTYRISAFEGTGVDTTLVYAAAEGFRPDTTRIIRGARTISFISGGTVSRAAVNRPVELAISSVSSDAFANQDRLRPGGPGLDLTVSSSNPAVARFATVSDTGGAVAVHLDQGLRLLPTGRLMLDPLATGITTLSATTSGVPTVSHQLTVTQASLYVQNWIAITNQVQERTVNISEANHGGSTVTLRSADPAMIRLSTAGGPIADSVIIFVPDGTTSGPFTLHRRVPVATGDRRELERKDPPASFKGCPSVPIRNLILHRRPHRPREVDAGRPPHRGDGDAPEARDEGPGARHPGPGARARHHDQAQRRPHVVRCQGRHHV
jgi:hypothetical protein